MIIWLASYPRSGNTLLRTILYQCFNKQNYTMDRPILMNDPATFAPTKEIIGGRHYDDSDWDTFYRRSTRSSSRFFVKTHSAPVDDQPAIYVLRDGRSAALSYLDYYNSVFPDLGRTLTQIITGDDVYGGWSDHIERWTRRHKGPLLVLRFDELVDATHETLQHLADFIGYRGAIKPWVNPREELNRKVPWFVRDGATSWQARSPWSEHHDRLFYAFHGKMMQELGFYSPDELARLQQDPMNEPYAQLADTIRRLINDKHGLQGICDERQQIITDLLRGWSGQLNRYVTSIGRRIKRVIN
jgi:hypothetical protein